MFGHISQIFAEVRVILRTYLGTEVTSRGSVKESSETFIEINMLIRPPCKPCYSSLFSSIYKNIIKSEI